MPGPTVHRSLVARHRSGLPAFLLSEEPPEWFWRSPGVTAPPASGVSVTDQTALRVTAVLSCVKVLAESISTLPLMVSSRDPNGDKRPVPEHPLSQVHHTLASEESTAQSIRETLSAHASSAAAPTPASSGTVPRTSTRSGPSPRAASSPSAAAWTGRRPATLAKQVADAGGVWWMAVQAARLPFNRRARPGIPFVEAGGVVSGDGLGRRAPRFR
jgi:hypothetical protein